MAILARIGFEMNSTTNGVEVSSSVGSPSITSSNPRSGGFAGRISSLSSGTAKGFNYQFFATAGAGAGPFFNTIYLRVATLPSAENRIISLRDTNAGADRAWITLGSDGTLKLYDEDGVIGSASSALSLNTYYKIGLKYDSSGAGATDVIEARLDNVVFATASNRNISTGVDTARAGGNLGAEAQTTGDWQFDDWKINDATGSVETSYPTDGLLAFLPVDAAGDVNPFATQTGGTAGAANNYTRVDEVPPDDVTTFNGSNTLDEEDMFNCPASGLGANDAISAVLVGARYRNNTSDATTAFKVQVKKAPAGTVSQSSAIVRNGTSWITNQPNVPRTYPIIAHTDPDGAAWTKDNLDTMQIGYKLTTGGTNRIEVSAVWAYVEYIPSNSYPKILVF